MEREVTQQLIDDISAITSAMVLTSRHGLGPEVILSAMKFYREDPTITVEQAIALGLEEWDI